MLIYPTLLADIQSANRKSTQGPRGGDIQLFNPFSLYCFTVMSQLHVGTGYGNTYLEKNKGIDREGSFVQNWVDKRLFLYYSNSTARLQFYFEAFIILFSLIFPVRLSNCCRQPPVEG